MPRYLADTSAWNRSARVADVWSDLLETNEIALCLPVSLELLYSARGRRDYESLAFDLEGFHHLAIDRRAERAAARTQFALAARGRHRAANPIDLLIAAVAEVHEVTLLHYDVLFEMIARETGQPAEWIAPRGSLA